MDGTVIALFSSSSRLRFLSLTSLHIVPLSLCLIYTSTSTTHAPLLDLCTHMQQPSTRFGSITRWFLGNHRCEIGLMVLLNKRQNAPPRCAGNGTRAPAPPRICTPLSRIFSASRRIASATAAHSAGKILCWFLFALRFICMLCAGKTGSFYHAVYSNSIRALHMDAGSHTHRRFTSCRHCAVAVLVRGCVRFSSPSSAACAYAP